MSRKRRLKKIKTIKIMSAILSVATVIATMAAVMFYIKAYILFGICMTVVAIFGFVLSVMCFWVDTN